MNLNTVRSIRKEFVSAMRAEDFVTDKSGALTLEIVGGSFLADDKCIFGQVNEDYIDRELAWYKSKSHNINDIPGEIPAIWKQVADKAGMVNSNYGNLIWGSKVDSVIPFSQYEYVLNELKNNPNSRRAVMIYTRPEMWFMYNYNGRSDFVCTNTVQYFIRNNRLYGIVQMRSNDVVFGYNNDYAWQMYVINQLSQELNIELGHVPLTWQVGSLHVYERHFYLIDYYTRTGEINISRKTYDAFHPHSRWTKKSIENRMAEKIYGDGEVNIDMEQRS